MINLENNLIQQWLRKISLSGRLISIDETAKLAENHHQFSEVNGFAIINAKSNEEISSLLIECPQLDIDDVIIFKLRD